MIQDSERVIFFADVVGSTKLYETLGDKEAHECISECLARISEFVASFDGEVVEIIGDEVMALFQEPIAASRCACEVQKFFFHNFTSRGHKVFFRIGFHKGAVGFNDGHPFGDTVNVASRVASLAQAGQSITTAETVESLPASTDFLCQPFGRVKVKGKAETLNTIKVDWDVGSATALRISPQLPTLQVHAGELEIVHGDHVITISEQDAPYTIGRDASCSQVVASFSSSRIHLSIDVKFGKWYMSDRSTNGTYIKLLGDIDPLKSDAALYLHHSEWVMAGSGIVGLGKKPNLGDPECIQFTCK